MLLQSLALGISAESFLGTFQSKQKELAIKCKLKYLAKMISTNTYDDPQKKNFSITNTT